MSEARTSELNGGSFLIYVCIVRTSIACVRAPHTDNMSVICSVLSCFATCSEHRCVTTCRRAIRRTRERERARRAAETARYSQERLTKRRERDRAGRSTLTAAA